MKNLLVTIEFEDKNFLLLNQASKLAQKFGSKVWIVHIAAPDPYFVGYEVGPQYIRDNRAEELRKEHKMIQDYTNELKKNDIEAEGLLLQGATAETILNECAALNIDLLIIGHHKHSFLQKTFGDSVVSSIIDKSKVPMLVIPVGEKD